MFETLIMQVGGGEAASQSVWNLFLAISGIFATVSAIAIGITLRIRKRLADNTDENSKKIVSIIDDFVLPIFNSGQEFVDKTKEQEGKIKEIGEILYGFMGDKANEIVDKNLVKIDKLTADTNTANIQAEDYKQKLDRLGQLLDELKMNPQTPLPQTKAAKSSSPIR